MEGELFRKITRFLKTHAGVKYPIYIRRVKMAKTLDGDCEFDAKRKCFLIRINKGLNEQHSIDVAIHEIAHAMAWGLDNDWHGSNWGRCYSKIYRKFLDCLELMDL